MHIIAHIHTDFKEKFGIPRQSGLVDSAVGYIVFEKEYRHPEALRGIEGYSHLWLLWQFSECAKDGWSPTVRPPRLGGNRRMGVFATRSPFRPNPIGLSSVRLLGVEEGAQGHVLVVCGADLLDGTPIYDIKPYLPYTDCHTDATGGFADEVQDYHIDVDIPATLATRIGEAHIDTVRALLSQDPRPSYQSDPTRTYYMTYAHLTIAFRVQDGVLHVTDVKDGGKD